MLNCVNLASKSEHGNDMTSCFYTRYERDMNASRNSNFSFVNISFPVVYFCRVVSSIVTLIMIKWMKWHEDRMEDTRLKFVTHTFYELRLTEQRCRVINNSPKHATYACQVGNNQHLGSDVMRT